jgi:iron-sulfur cluster assembly protein
MEPPVNTSPAKPRRERPKPVKLTDAAAARLQEIMAGADGKYLGLRVGVTNGGCAGMSYTMAYAEDTKPFEEVMEDKGVKIFIDPKAILFLIGTELDFVKEKLGARFIFNNPNQTAACGCGESVSITPAAS